MTDSLFEAVALCSKELMKYSLSAEEFAVLAQKNGMTDSEILAVSKTFEYLRDKKKRESVEFLLRTSRLPLKAPKTFDNFDFNRITGKNVEKLRSLSTLSALYAHKNLAFIGKPGTGKTHLAQAFGRACCEQGLKAYFIKMTELRDRMTDARRTGWNSQENRTPMSKTLSGKRVIGEASSFDQWREIQFIGSVAPAAVVVGLDPAEYDLANLIPLHGGAVEPVDQFLLQRCEKTLHARVVKAAMRAAHALPDGTEPGEHRPVLLAGVLAAVVGVQYQPLLITIA